MSSIKITLERRLASVNLSIEQHQAQLETENKVISEITSTLMTLTKEKQELDKFLSEYSKNETNVR